MLWASGCGVLRLCEPTRRKSTRRETRTWVLVKEEKSADEGHSITRRGWC